MFRYQGYWTEEGRMDGNGAYTFADGSKSRWPSTAAEARHDVTRAAENTKY